MNRRLLALARLPRGTYLFGHLVAAVMSMGLFYGCDWVQRKWDMPFAIAFAVSILPLLAFAVVAARHHRSFRLAVLAPLAGAIIGATAVAAALEILSPDPDDEIAPRVVVFVLAPILGTMIWIPAAMASVITVRVRRGRWGSPPPGHCPNCGYSLEGLRGQTCPECGNDCSRIGVPSRGPE